MNWIFSWFNNNSNDSSDESFTLHDAIDVNDVRAVRDLLEDGTTPTTRDLEFALEECHLPIARLLIQYGAQLDDSDEMIYSIVDGGKSPLKTLQFLAKHEVDFSTAQHALHRASYYASPKIVSFLVRHGTIPLPETIKMMKDWANKCKTNKKIQHCKSAKQILEILLE